MDTNSLIQSDSQSAALETAEELAGTLEIPADPVISTGFADIYHGFWTSLQGVRVEVAVKQFKNLVPRVRQTEQEELKKKKETVSILQYLNVTQFTNAFSYKAYKTRSIRLEPNNTPKSSASPWLPFGTPTAAHQPLVPSWKSGRILARKSRLVS